MTPGTEQSLIDGSPSEVLTRYVTCGHLTQSDLAYFIERGVDPVKALAGLTWEELPVRRAKVVAAGHKRFIFPDEHRLGDDESVNSFILPVTDREGRLVDLLAWDPATSWFALWLGRASILGAANLDVPRLGEPLAVFRSPLDWLRHDRSGVVILDNFGAAFVDWDCTLEADDEEHRLELQRALSRPGPTVVVAKRGTAAA